MGVVARLDVHTVEHSKWGLTYKMQPVVAAGDEHDEEIKRFFAATPSGSVLLSLTGDPFQPGDQCYLYIDTERHEDSLPLAFEVRSISLNGWATQVEFKAENRVIDGITHSSMDSMTFSIRNETAAEQFQVGSKFYVRLEKVSS